MTEIPAYLQNVETSKHQNVQFYNSFKIIRFCHFLHLSGCLDEHPVKDKNVKHDPKICFTPKALTYPSGTVWSCWVRKHQFRGSATSISDGTFSKTLWQFKNIMIITQNCIGIHYPGAEEARPTFWTTSFDRKNLRQRPIANLLQNLEFYIFQCGNIWNIWIVEHHKEN